jgi:hypothetical protein
MDTGLDLPQAARRVSATFVTSALVLSLGYRWHKRPFFLHAMKVDDAVQAFMLGKDNPLGLPADGRLASMSNDDIVIARFHLDESDLFEVVEVALPGRRQKLIVAHLYRKVAGSCAVKCLVGATLHAVFYNLFEALRNHFRRPRHHHVIHHRTLCKVQTRTELGHFDEIAKNFLAIMRLVVHGFFGNNDHVVSGARIVCKHEVRTC